MNEFENEWKNGIMKLESLIRNTERQTFQTPELRTFQTFQPFQT